MNRSTIQNVTLWFGVVYVLIGILGFIPGITVMSTRPGAMPGEGLLLGIFAVNIIHNIAHLALGAVLIWGGRSPSQVITVNKAMSVVFVILVIASFIAPLVEGVAINAPDTVLHLISALLTGYMGFVAPRSAALTPS